MRIFKLKVISRFTDDETDKLVEKGSIFKIVDETRGGALLRKYEDKLANEIYELPHIEIENPSDSVVSAVVLGVEKVIEPKKSIIIDKVLGAELLKLYGFLIAKEYVKPEKAKVSKRKKATKKVVKVAKSKKKK